LYKPEDGLRRVVGSGQIGNGGCGSQAGSVTLALLFLEWRKGHTTAIPPIRTRTTPKGQQGRTSGSQIPSQKRVEQVNSDILGGT
jgi:hypothetical protein